MAKASKAARVAKDIRPKKGVNKPKGPVVPATAKTAPSKEEKARLQKEAKQAAKQKMAAGRTGVKDMDS